MKHFLYISLACLFLTACHNTTTTENILTSDSILVKADTMYEGGTPLLANIRILYGNTLVFNDSRAFYETNSEQVIPYKDSVLYVLIKEFDPISMKSLHVLRYAGKKEVSEMVILGEQIEDIDQDGIIEVIGQELSEAACIDCDSAAYVTYSPILVHKLGLYCVFDESLSKELTTLKYGCYLGEQHVDTFLLVNKSQETTRFNEFVQVFLNDSIYQRKHVMFPVTLYYPAENDDSSNKRDSVLLNENNYTILTLDARSKVKINENKGDQPIVVVSIPDTALEAELYFHEDKGIYFLCKIVITGDASPFI